MTAVNQYQKKTLAYQVNNIVWLSTKNIKTKKLLKKLDHKMIGPYKVKILIRLSYRLDLSTNIRIHTVFHPNLLQPAATNLLPGQHNKPEPPVVVDSEKKKGNQQYPRCKTWLGSWQKVAILSQMEKLQ